MNSLRIVLALNASSCIVFGGFFAMTPASVAQFIGTTSTGIVLAVGILLLLNGLHLVLAAHRPKIADWEVYYFSAGDILWVNLTLALVSSGILITTPSGSVVALAIAAGVGAMGLVQVWLVRHGTGIATTREAFPTAADDHLPEHLCTFGAIGASWLSMKTWIKVWLFGVNGIFLAALAFWPDPIAKVSIAAYVASVPWLFAFVVAQRGLTRLLGLAHLIPWLPLLGYLLLRLTSDRPGPQLMPGPGLLAIYTIVLAVVVGICLVLDVIDVWRWLRGEHFRLGSVAAARVGASQRAADCCATDAVNKTTTRT